MPLVFREDKATQVASRMLEMAGGSLGVLPLVKLVYVVDRTCLERYGRPVTFDTFYNMAHGPVVSSTMDCINAQTNDDAPVWSRHVGRRDGHSVQLLKPAEPYALSAAEEAVIEDVFREHGHKSIGEWIEFSHSLPEWENPAPKKRHGFRYRDILKAAGWNDEDVAQAVHDLTAEARATLLFG
jgi:uncharacterized phage-associated protein